MAPRRILLVRKTPRLDRLEPDEVDRLVATGAADRAALESAARHHETALAAVRRALRGHAVVEVQVERLHPADARDAELVLALGGDGTVFTANTLETEAPFLTVNSDPGGSLGAFTRVHAGTVAAAIDVWLAGRAAIEEMPRLDLRLGERRWRLLNDCLFTCTHPAAMSRYVLTVGDRREHQRSSGVWVATGAGSTAAIRSSGLEPPVDAHLPALLYNVREPFHGRAPSTMLQGRQLPPAGLAITAAMAGLACYIDGPNLTVPVPAGATVRFAASPSPLRLVTIP